MKTHTLRIAKRAGKFLLITILTLFLALSLQATEKEIALNYYNQALYFHARGNTAQAAKLCLSALEFMPTFSDAYYLLYRLSTETEEPVDVRIAWLRKALGNGNWQYEGKHEADRALAGLLFRIKSYPEAREILEPIPDKDASDSILLIRVLDILGKTELRDTQIRTALQRFPGSRPLYELSARFKGEAGDLTAAGDIIAVALTLFPEDTQLLFLNLKYAQNHEAKQEAYHAYLTAGGMNPEAALLALEASPADPESCLLFFLKNRGLTDLSLKNRLENLLDEKLGTWFLEQAQAEYPPQGIPPRQFLDSNGDGYAEIVYTYDENGSVSSLVKDENQDGNTDLELKFRDGIPYELLQQEGEEQIHWYYNPYPLVQRVTITSEKTHSEYRLIPSSLSHTVLKNTQTIPPLLLPGPAHFPLTKVMKAAYRLNIRSGEGKGLLISRELRDGEPVSEKIDSDGDGVFDHHLTYTAGLPVKGFRDFDNDSIFDATEYYDTGKLDRIEFDENNDNKPDALQIFRENGTSISYWDYNYDGAYDARQTLTPDRLSYSFTTGPGKYLDLTLTFINGELREIKRGEKNLTITPGPPGIYWIGKRGSRLPVFAESESGRIDREGKQYFLFRYNNKIYIEELQ